MFNYDEEITGQTYKEKMIEDTNKIKESLKQMIETIETETRPDYIKKYKEEIHSLERQINMRTKVIPLMNGDEVIPLNV